MRALALGLLCALVAFAAFWFLFALVCSIAHSSLEDIAGGWSALVLSVLYGIAAVVWFRSASAGALAVARTIPPGPPHCLKIGPIAWLRPAG